ncbi:hypothetical protein AHAS_Ahas12G0227100 [Arachis hypogaea]
MASSSSSLLDAPRIKHDVFISFRGEDIRTSFLSHLRKELHHNHIDFFVDDEKLHPGDDISSTLIQAIEESSISLVIFSENYASSTWCLNELVKVIQCMKQDQRIVIPVFYNVVPSDVRHQNNSFKEAFDKHRHRLKGNMRKVQIILVFFYAKGVPLALKVLGSFLYSKTIEEWKSALGKLKIYPNIDIFNVLKLSYDGLDDLEKDIFLDIVFFFKGEDKDVVVPFLESCGFFPAIGIGNLSRKALITISNRNTIEMHDLIGQMGREIVRQESIKDPGRRSRLSNHEDVYNVLNNNKGTDSVEGIMLDLSQIKRDLHLDADTFKRMPNIRFLKFYDSWRQKESANVHVSSTFDSFPKELRYLEWSGCPVKSLPPNICAEKLVKLSMPDSQVSKLWDGVQDLVNLKKINLRGCKQLVELPDFSRASNLEEICLIECVRLFELHPSILSIHKLENLSVWGCKALKSLKSNIHLKSLKKLDVRCCSSMKEFSVSSEELMSLNFNGTIIEMLQSSVGRLSKLVECDLSNVRLETLPNELCLLVSLEKLNLEGCKQLIELPHNMKALSRLQDLNITGCCSLGSLPELPPSLIHLSATNCRSLEKLFNIKTLFSLNLKSISFENCERLDEHSFLEYVHLTMMGVAIRDILADMLQYKIEPHADDDDTTFFPESNNQVFYPGSKVPPWFIYQTREASVTIDLPADQPLNQLVGFILCCVVYHIPSHIESPTTSRAFYSKRPPKIRCQYSGFGYSKQFAKTSRWNSDHVCIWFHAAHNRQWHGNNATFKFKAETLSEFKVETRCEDYTPWNKRIPYVWRVIEEWEVIGCGVYPIYASDILDVFQKVDPQFQFFKDRSSWERKSGIGRTDLQSVYTLEEVKTRMIHKMEADQKRFSSVSRICRISNNRTRMSMVSLKPKEVSQRLNEEENQVDQRNSSPLPWRLVNLGAEITSLIGEGREITTSVLFYCML